MQIFDEVATSIAKDIYKKHKAYHTHIFSLQFKELCDYDTKIAVWRAAHINSLLSDMRLVSKYQICYDVDNIIFWIGADILKHFITVKIPYGERSKYFKIIYEINNFVDVNGMVAIAVCNNPYNLESLLLIETHCNTDKIKDLIAKAGLSVDTSRGLHEISQEVTSGKWYLRTFVKDTPEVIFLEMMKSAFIFPEKKVLEEQLFNGFSDKRRPKVFISYAHKDKQLVSNIVNAMEDFGIDAWIDKKCIDYGDEIVDKVHAALKACDYAIIFISKATKEALFAKHELHVLYNDVIYQSKKWFPVKLDDVDVNSIIHGMKNYLYYDFSENCSVDELVQAIKNQLAKLE